jgi:hypothetical protein
MPDSVTQPILYKPSIIDCPYTIYPFEAHVKCPSTLSELLPVRKFAMMHIIDCITDIIGKSHSREKIVNDAVVLKWFRAAFSTSNEDLWRLQ